MKTPSKFAVGIFLYLLFFLTLSPFSVANADGSQGGQGAIILNPGGGSQVNGSDGIKIVINGLPTIAPYVGSDQLYFAATEQWCCGGTSPLINVGGQLFGEAGAASFGSTSWTSIALISSSGAVQTLPVGTSTISSTSTGNSSAVIRYSALKNGLTYVVDRSITYVYPNNFYTENYTFTIPAGNTEVVKFYQGGDASPGSDDSGRGFSVSSPTVAAYEVNTASGIYISYQQTLGGVPFDGLFVGPYAAPYSTIQSGGNIGFVTDTSVHDAGLDMQWTLGSTPGVYTRSMITQAGFQSTQVTASFSNTSIEAGQNTNFVIQIVNTNFSSRNNLAFSTQLPSGISINGSPSNTCGGTVTATLGTSSISLSGGTVSSAANCLITVPVTAAVGTYSWSDQTFSVTSPLVKGFATSTLNVSAGPQPAPAPTLPATGGSTNDNPNLGGFAYFLIATGAVALWIVKRKNLGFNKR